MRKKKIEKRRLTEISAAGSATINIENSRQAAAATSLTGVGDTFVQSYIAVKKNRVLVLMVVSNRR